MREENKKQKIKYNKTQTNPLVSVIMPVYNACSYLVPALDSIIQQTYFNWELIAVDDASSDDSYLILKQYSQMDSRIKVYKNAYNMGVSKTANFAISKAKGKYLMRMDADDISFSTRMEKQLQFLLKNKDCVVVGGQVKLINKEGKFTKNKIFPINNKEIYNVMYTAMSLQQGAMMVNTNLLPKNFEWYNGVRTAEEVKLFFKLFNYGKFTNISDFVLKYRQYNNSTSLKNAKETFKITYKTRKLAEQKFGYKPTLKASLINELQNVLVSLLPSRLIYPLFFISRNLLIFKPNLTIKNIKVAQKAVKKAVVFVNSFV